MLEVRFHGRGGQGTVLASYMLCKASFLEGKDVQSFTFFGAERRGAPVVAFARISSRPILVRSPIHVPNRIVVLDPGLSRIVDVFTGVKSGCLVFINAEGVPEEIAVGIPCGVEVVSMNATRIALRHRLGTPEAPIVNTAILGGFAGATGIVGCKALEEAVRTTVPQQADRNVAALKEAYDLAKEGRTEHVRG